MSVYHVYTLTKSKEIYGLYVCEQCGETNLFKTQIKGQGSYDDRGAGFRKATVASRMEERNDRANACADNKLYETINNLKLNCSLNVLEKNPIKCKCRKCGKEPFWTLSTLLLIKKIAKIVTGLAVAAALIFSSTKNVSTNWKVIGPVAAAALCWIAYFAYRAVCSKQFASKTLPVFDDSIESIRDRIKRLVGYENVSI